jgi:uncharacterized membrane protein YGL010W
MRSVASWLDEYGESHHDPTNKLLHFICVPAIVLAVLGLLASIPTPAGLNPWLNVATLVALLVLIYYALLSLPLAAGMLLVFALLGAAVHGLAALSWPLWLTSLAIFVIAWAGQFWGHAIEGRRPSFFKDLQFLLIGPLWLLAALYRRLGLPC